VWAYENIAFHASIDRQLYLSCADEVAEQEANRDWDERDDWARQIADE
jgi:hypothetical protein